MIQPSGLSERGGACQGSLAAVKMAALVRKSELMPGTVKLAFWRSGGAIKRQ